MTDPVQTDRAAGPAAGDADEFAHIPRARGRHPILAIAGALLAFFLVFHERHDLRYALSSETPLDLGQASALNQRALAGLENRYVRVAGTPDRESALEIDTKGSWVFTQLFRVLGTGDRLFVHRPPNPLPAAMAESDVFQGRLIRVDDLSFATAIRRYFATAVSATHFFAPAAFARAVGSGATGPITVPDLSGDPVALSTASVVAVEVAQPDQVRIGLPRARFATEPEARAAITSRGGEIVSALGEVRGRPLQNAPESGALSATPEPPVRWTYVVRFPAAVRQAALDALGNLDHDVEIRDARQSVQLRVDEITAGTAPGGLTLRAGQGPAREIAPAAVAAIHTIEPVLIPSDAYLLVEGDHPRQHLPTVLIAVILLMFGAVNLVGLGRELRR